MAKAESALVILVPEAEPLVRPFLERFDPSAATGVPAHITLLYPFLAPERIGKEVVDQVAQCCRGFAPIAYSLTEIRRFRPRRCIWHPPRTSRSGD